MAKLSAAMLLFKSGAMGFEVFLVHPGGPFWEKKDLGAWSLPKGEYDQREDPLSAALREFEEETSFRLEPDNVLPLGQLKQPGGKIITAWALEKDVDPALVKSNTFEMEWPPKSGKRVKFPEVDRAEFFNAEGAKEKMHAAEFEFIGRLEKALNEKETP